jgi:hypothetical protein
VRLARRQNRLLLDQADFSRALFTRGNHNSLSMTAGPKAQCRTTINALMAKGAMVVDD